MAKKAPTKFLHKNVTKPKRGSVREASDGTTVGGDALPRKKLRKQVVSPKTRALIGALLDDPDLTLKKAGEKAGWLRNSASMASQALKSASARELFRREMAKRPGLAHSALAEKLEQGLSATQTKLFAHEGSIVDERELVDYGARHAYLSLATKLADLDPASRTELTGANGEKLIPPSQQQQIIVLPQLTVEQLLALLEIKEPSDAPAPAASPAPLDGGAESATGVSDLPEKSV